MKTLYEKINKDFLPKIQAELGIKNKLALPKIEKIVINVGVRSDIKDSKVIDSIEEDLKMITGQVPVKTRAKKSISSFKVRENQVVGLMVTLRSQRMYEFLDKFFNITLARVRDFRGLDDSGFDAQGNYSVGFRDQIAFPEISADKMKHPFGMQITIVTNAKSPEQAKKFLTLIGLPLKK